MNDKGYILVTFYNRGTESLPIWSVYGHIAFGLNDCVGEFTEESEAIRLALSFHGAPAMRGTTQLRSVRQVLNKLSDSKIPS